MIFLFKLITICVIWCLGIKIITSDGMVLSKLGKWGSEKVDAGHMIYEPLFMCEWCMPSIHSLIAYMFAYGMGLFNDLTWSLLVIYPLVAMGSSLLNGVIWICYKTINAKKEYLESATALNDVKIEEMNEGFFEEEFEQFNIN